MFLSYSFLFTTTNKALYMYNIALWKLFFQCINTLIGVYYSGLIKDLQFDISNFRTDLVSNNLTKSCQDVVC